MESIQYFCGCQIKCIELKKKLHNQNDDYWNSGAWCSMLQLNQNKLGKDIETIETIPMKLSKN